MGIIDSIKTSVAKSGSNKEKILYVRNDSKVRVRFLQEFSEGYQFTFHDSFEKGALVSFIEQLGLAPSQIMPVRLAIMFLTAAATCS